MDRVVVMRALAPRAPFPLLHFTVQKEGLSATRRRRCLARRDQEFGVWVFRLE